MLSRREKILVVPWEKRRYENHIKKIKQALPVIDNRPPANRSHVWHKLKKQQNENERCAKIERDNFTLLRRMKNIMTTSRVDHYWVTPPPSFLSRVTMFDVTPTTILDFNEDGEETDADDIEHLRKFKCPACTPKKFKGPIIPEERIPWDYDIPILRSKQNNRSRSVPPKTLPKIDVERGKSSSAHGTRSKSDKIDHLEKLSSKPRRCLEHTLKISRGSLELKVNFPHDSKLKVGQCLSGKLPKGE